MTKIIIKELNKTNEEENKRPLPWLWCSNVPHQGY
jgi:hypothetical protein